MIEYNRPNIRFLAPITPLGSSTRVRVLKVIEYLKKANEIAQFMDYAENLDEPAFNILVIQKYAGQQTINLIEKLKQKGVIIVYDGDAYNDPSFPQILSIVDGIIVDCEERKEFYKQFVPDKHLTIAIIPDMVDYIEEPFERISQKEMMKRTNNLGIVFFAIPSNLGEIDICKEALNKLSKEKKFKLTYISGDESRPEFFTDLNFSVSHIKWNLSTFSMELRKFDLAIIPQKKKEKGNARLVQAITHNLPVVVSDVKSHRYIAEQTDTTEFLCKTPDEWYEALKKMFNPEIRWTYLNKTVNWVWKIYTIDRIIHEYKKFFTYLLIKKRGTTYNYDVVD